MSVKAGFKDISNGGGSNGENENHNYDCYVNTKFCISVFQPCIDNIRCFTE